MCVYDGLLERETLAVFVEDEGPGIAEQRQLVRPVTSRRSRRARESGSSCRVDRSPRQHGGVAFARESRGCARLDRDIAVSNVRISELKRLFSAREAAWAGQNETIWNFRRNGTVCA